MSYYEQATASVTEQSYRCSVQTEEELPVPPTPAPGHSQHVGPQVLGVLTFDSEEDAGVVRDELTFGGSVEGLLDVGDGTPRKFHLPSGAEAGQGRELAVRITTPSRRPCTDL
ncbi:hypothetical protein ACIRUY_17840 [Streptomyces erythrochromogenes]|uniref:hypothetical protein n=1 Tax=Streptomyces erythrochromogenes TaxID=285574 RepID=UPI0037FBBE00